MENKLWIDGQWQASRGGLKQSGFGKDLSTEAIGDYQITKHVMVAH